MKITHRIRIAFIKLSYAVRRRIAYVKMMAPLWGNYLLAIPLLGLQGTSYFNHLDSSAVARMGYDSRSQTLDVHFVKGRSLYRYHEVSLFDFLYLARAPSLGQAMNERIIGEKACQHLTWYTDRGQVAKKRREPGIRVTNGPNHYPAYRGAR